MFKLESSNPALKNDEAFNPYAYREPGEAVAARPDVATVQGVVNKTAILVAICIAFGAVGYWLLGQMGMSIVTISCIASMIVCFGVYFVVAGNPARAVVVAPIYAAIEGVFLGSLTAGLETWLAAAGIKTTGGLALQAFVITIAILSAMLILYKTGILKPTRKLQAFVYVATLGIAITYLMTWVLWMFGQQMPFISYGSAFQGDTAALIGIGLNAFILLIAALWLIIDFGVIEQKVTMGAPRSVEWYCGFILLVSLAWIYYHAVEMAFRLAVMFNQE